MKNDVGVASRPYASSARTATNLVGPTPWLYTATAAAIYARTTSSGRVASVWKARGKLDGAGSEDSRLIYTHIHIHYIYVCVYIKGQ